MKAGVKAHLKLTDSSKFKWHKSAYMVSDIEWV